MFDNFRNVDLSEIKTPFDFDKEVSAYDSANLFRMCNEYKYHVVDGLEVTDIADKFSRAGYVVNKMNVSLKKRYVTEPKYIRIDSGAAMNNPFMFIIISMLELSERQGRNDGVCFIKSTTHLFKMFIDNIINNEDNVVFGFMSNMSLTQLKAMFYQTMKGFIKNDDIRIMYNKDGSRRYGYYSINYMRYRLTTVDDIFKRKVALLSSNYKYGELLDMTKDWEGFDSDLFNEMFSSVTVETKTKINPFSIVMELAKRQNEKSDNGIFPMPFKEVKGISRSTFKRMLLTAIDNGNIKKVGKGKYVLL